MPSQVVSLVEPLKIRYPILDILRFLNIPKSNYYRWKNQKPSDDEQQLRDLIQSIYEQHKGRYGYRRITAELRVQHKLVVNHKKVYRLMRDMGLKAKIRRKKYRYLPKLQNRKCKDLIERNFKASQPNKKWYTDVSTFKFGETPLYLSAIIDGFNNEVISVVVSEHPDLKLAYDTVNLALKNREIEEVILHSDQGSLYTSPNFQEFIHEKKNIVQSMSHKGVCYDNVQIESFFSHLKTEVFYSQEFTSTNTEILKIIKEYIDYYNNIRIQKKLNFLSPVQFREKFA